MSMNFAKRILFIFRHSLNGDNKMKLTKEQIIKEELQATLGEAEDSKSQPKIWANNQLALITQERMRPSGKLKGHLRTIPSSLEDPDMRAWFDRYKELRGAIKGYGTVENYTFPNFVDEVENFVQDKPMLKKQS